MYCTLVLREKKTREIPDYAFWGGKEDSEVHNTAISVYNGDRIRCNTKREALNIAKFLGEDFEIVREAF